MTRLSKLAGSVALGTLFTVCALTPAALATSITGHASADVKAAIAIEEWHQLDFKRVALQDPTQGGSVVLDVNGNYSAANNLKTFDAVGQFGRFHVTGYNNSTIALSAIPNVASLENPNVILSAFTTDFTGFLNAGVENFNVGATLNLPAGVTPGLYTFTYPVTVQYN